MKFRIIWHVAFSLETARAGVIGSVCIGQIVDDRARLRRREDRVGSHTPGRGVVDLDQVVVPPGSVQQRAGIRSNERRHDYIC